MTDILFVFNAHDELFSFFNFLFSFSTTTGIVDFVITANWTGERRLAFAIYSPSTLSSSSFSPVISVVKQYLGSLLPSTLLSFF